VAPPDLATPTRPPGAEAGGHALRFYDVASADGTRLRAWSNDVDGPTVLLCNGLGTSPYAWPALLRPDCGVHVVSWYHRGVSGSERPDDQSRVDLTAFVEDALAVLDDAGVVSCPVVGWSLGVDTAFELALEHPERVTGVFAVAGVPGGTFTSIGAPLMVPRFARRPLAVAVTTLLGRTGWALTPFTSSLPVGAATANLLRHSGLILPSAKTTTVQNAVAEFLTTPVEWYMHLAHAATRHGRLQVSRVRVPTVFVAGTYDLLADAEEMRTLATRMRRARYVELGGSHFVQMEHPEEVHEELLAFVGSVGCSP
jgi:pimeloyl-ACP methyl ester carboxylesterase